MENFRWVDYEENSALFVNGAELNIAILRHKDFRLTENITNKQFKIKANCLEDAKNCSVTTVVEYWRDSLNSLKVLNEIINK